jgi:DNA-binding MarR family transcriptional regulator
LRETETAVTPVEHELDAPPWRRVEATLMAVSRAIRRAYDARLAELEINLSEASLLAFVHDHGPLTQTHLAGRLAIGRAATGSLVDALEGRGLVERRRLPGDRRVWLVAATREAEPILEQIGAIDRLLRDQLRSGVTKAERQRLDHTLLRLQRNLKTLLIDDH